MANKFCYIVIGIITVFALVPGLAKAAVCASHNVYGYAWSDNIGWVSFACQSGTDYGVDIASDGLFSGYAWSDNVGWISFEPADLVGCPSGSCPAELDPATGEVSGWAKVLSTGSWFGLRDEPLYGTYVNTTDGQFHDWAWSDDFGWLSFNCLEGGGCGSAPYKVETSFLFGSVPPSKPTNLGVELNNCEWKEASVPKFSWTSSVPTTGYEIHLDADDPTVSSPEFVWEVDSGSSESILEPAQYKLAFNHFWYYWKVKVKNNGTNWSEWSNVNMFNTPLHARPWVDFAPVPSNPALGEVVSFIQDDTDGNPYTSLCYDGGEHLCEDDSSVKFEWNFDNGGSAVDYTCNRLVPPFCSGNTSTSYDTSGTYYPVLTITDPTVGNCKYSRTIRVGLPFPEWQEIKPR